MSANLQKKYIMNCYFSDKIKVMSFVSILLVLYGHSGFHDYPNEIAGMKFNFYLQEFVGAKITRCTIPLFFAISGYLFFLHTEGGIDIVIQKIRRRVRTLLIPFLIACLFMPLFYVVLDFVPYVERFVNCGGFTENLKLPISKLVASLFFDSGSGTPWAFQLWFLRDLIIMVALSPILYYIKCSKVSGWVVCLMLYGLSLLEIPILPFDGLVWFMFGAYYLDALEKISHKRIIVASFFILCVIELILADWEARFPLVQTPIVLMGVVSLWSIYDWIVPESFKLSQHKVLSLACGFSFFIYLYHEPTLNVVRKLLVLPFGHNSFSFAFSYLTSPWVFTLLFVPIGMLLKKYIPTIYSTIVGGR